MVELRVPRGIACTEGLGCMHPQRSSVLPKPKLLRLAWIEAGNGLLQGGEFHRLGEVLGEACLLAALDIIVHAKAAHGNGRGAAALKSEEMVEQLGATAVRQADV